MSADRTYTAEMIAELRRTGAYHRCPANRPWLSGIPVARELSLYLPTLIRVMRLGRLSAAGRATDDDVAGHCLSVLQRIVDIGGEVHVSGLDHYQRLAGPAVFVGNHMSTLETFVLPGFMLLFREVTFVLKQSLREYPYMGDILRRLNAIAVTRRDPRADLKKVLVEGAEHLQAGRSVIIFPQSTRTVEFAPERFNTLGIKLAARGGVPVIPFAVQTELWGNGSLVKDFGPVDLARPVRFDFGEPIALSGKGREAHQEVIRFVQTQLERWQAEPAGS